MSFSKGSRDVNGMACCLDSDRRSRRGSVAGSSDGVGELLRGGGTPQVRRSQSAPSCRKDSSGACRSTPGREAEEAYWDARHLADVCRDRNRAASTSGGYAVHQSRRGMPPSSAGYPQTTPSTSGPRCPSRGSATTADSRHQKRPSTRQRSALARERSEADKAFCIFREASAVREHVIARNRGAGLDLLSWA